MRLFRFRKWIKEYKLNEYFQTSLYSKKRPFVVFKRPLIHKIVDSYYDKREKTNHRLFKYNYEAYRIVDFDYYKIIDKKYFRKSCEAIDYVVYLFNENIVEHPDLIKERSVEEQTNLFNSIKKYYTFEKNKRI